MRMKTAILLLVLLASFLFVGPVSVKAVVRTCNSCGDCYAKINSAASGDIVELTQSITYDGPGVCIFWVRNGVTFDCKNNAIKTNYHAISLGAGVNNTIRNCIIQGKVPENGDVP